MPFVLLGWIVGTSVGFLLGGLGLLSLGATLPAFLTPFLPSTSVVPVVVIVLMIVAGYLAAYLLASVGVAPSLPAGAAFPLATPLTPPASVAFAPAPVEFFGRGVAIGLTASLNTTILALVPAFGIVIAPWVFLVISLAIFGPLAISPFYQGFLGWSAWLFPVSYVATGVGLLLFVVNAPVAFAAGGIGAFRLDFTTGVIETAGGLVGPPITSFVGGFSLGNFNFISVGATPDSFVGRGLSSHETGHSLNTAAMGGIVLWINAIDENVAPRRMNLAYGELTAESHAQGLPPIVGAPARIDFFVRLWS